MNKQMLLLAMLLSISAMQFSCNRNRVVQQQPLYEGMPEADNPYGDEYDAFEVQPTSEVITAPPPPPSNNSTYYDSAPVPPATTTYEAPPPVYEAPPPPAAPAPPPSIAGYTADNIHYRIQIGAFAAALPDDSDFFYNLNGDDLLYYDYNNAGLIRYTVGQFFSHSEAESYAATLQSRGYGKAFVVAYGNDGRKIGAPIQDVLRVTGSY